MNIFGSGLITSDMTLLVWGAALVIVAVAIYLSERYKWGRLLSSICLCMLLGFIFANLGIIPHSAPAYDAMSSVLLPVSIPLFLFKADLREIVKSTGKLFGLFHIAAIGTMIGVVVCYFTLNGFENTRYILGLIGAGSVGGTVNVVAMANMFEIPPGIMESYLVVGNFCVMFLFMLASAGKTNKFVLKHLPRSADDLQVIAGENGADESSSFWGGKEIGLMDIAKGFGASFVIVGISSLVASWVQSLGAPMFIEQMFGSVYMIMTLVTLFCATVFKKFFSSIRGTMEFGNICMLLWTVTVGASGVLSDILQNGMLAAALFLGVAIINLIVTFFGAKLLKMSWSDAIVANLATVGGPPTAAAVAIANGWHSRIVPGILIGIWGYIIGNYCGIVVCNIMGLTYIL